MVSVGTIVWLSSELMFFAALFAMYFSIRAAAPELQATLDDILAEGEKVALRWSARGTHLGEWLDVPPTGHHFTMSGISIYRIAQGKAVEGWNSIEVNPTEEEQRWFTEGSG